MPNSSVRDARSVGARAIMKPPRNGVSEAICDEGPRPQGAREVRPAEAGARNGELFFTDADHRGMVGGARAAELRDVTECCVSYEPPLRLRLGVRSAWGQPPSATGASSGTAGESSGASGGGRLLRRRLSEYGRGQRRLLRYDRGAREDRRGVHGRAARR